MTGEAAERYVLERIVEKATRALNMLAAGSGPRVREYPDMASLALCAEALRRRGEDVGERVEDLCVPRCIP